MRRTVVFSAKLLLLAGVALSAGYLLALYAEDDKPTKKDFVEAQNRLKQIGLAFHGYGEAHKDRWADDITDKEGHVLLSWRVALLPYMGEKELYKQFKLDEPWDSEHNKKLIPKMPRVYAPARAKAKEGETFCQRFVGKDALFNERGSDYTIPSVPDGTSNTALVVEAGVPVVWTKPADLPFNPKAPLPELGGLFDGDFHVLLCDGSVILCRKDYDADEMNKVVMPADGNPVDLERLQKPARKPQPPPR